MGFKRVSRDPKTGAEIFLNKVLAKETKAVVAGAVVFVGVIKETLSQPGTGAIRAAGRDRVGAGSFSRGKDGQLHLVRRGAARVNFDPTNRASAPGEPPAPDTGHLRNSIDYQLTSETTARVGTNLEYAAPLEMGTIRIAPRPFMRPSFHKAAPQMGPVVASELRFGRENG